VLVVRSYLVHMSRRFSDFLMASSFFNSKNCSVLAACFQKTGGFARNWPIVRAKIASDKVYGLKFSFNDLLKQTLFFSYVEIVARKGYTIIGTERLQRILTKNHENLFTLNSWMAHLNAVPPLALHGVVESPLVLRHAGGVQPGIVLLKAGQKFLIRTPNSIHE
jgi:hypothetical protein